MLKTLFIRVFRSMSQPYFLRYVLLSVVAVVIGFAVLLSAVGVGLAHTQWLRWGWMDSALDAVMGAGTLWLSWLLFPMMIPLLGAFLSEFVAGALEREEYGVSETPSLPLLPQVTGALWFMFTSLLWNIAALIFLIFPPLWLVVYYVMNGWLLGRDFFETVAVRHVLPAEAASLRRVARWRIWGAGMVLVVVSQIPILNLCAPFVAIAVMVHVFWGARQA